MDKQLQKLIDLSNKTGDRLIVVDSSFKQRAFVVMGVDDYEAMAVGRSEVRGLTEDELLDKINRDIAIWKSDKIDDESVSRPRKFSEELFPDNSDSREENNDDDDDDWYSIDEIGRKAEYNFGNNESRPSKKTGAWRIPSERKRKAEEIIEEDRYYLENIED